MVSRVLLIGWDGAGWDMIDPLLAAGRMPNLASLLERGVRGTHVARRPLLSPVIWTTIATGRPPHEHGIVGYAQPWRNRRGVSPVRATSRRCPAIWELIDGAHVIGWPVTHPVWREGQGVIVSDRFPMRSAYGLPMSEAEITDSLHPLALRQTFETIARRGQNVDVASLRQFVPRLAEIDRATDRRLPTIAGVIAETMTIHGLTRHVLENEGHWRFAAVHFPGIERLARMFMEFHPLRLPFVDQREFELFSDVMAQGYELHDRVLGSLLEAAGEDVTILLVSDHGFHHDVRRPGFSPSANRASHERVADTWHHPEGIWLASGLLADRWDKSRDIFSNLQALFGIFGHDELTRTRAEPRDDAERASDESIAHLLACGYAEPSDPAVEREVEQCEFANALNLARSFLDAGLTHRARGVLEAWLVRRPDDDVLRRMMAEASQAGGNTR
jgi:hypothetical protein